MIKQYPHINHRRNKSQLPLYLCKNKRNHKGNIGNKSSKKHKKDIKHNQINTLIDKSSKKISKKHIFVENLQEYDKESQKQQFFCFGKGISQRPQPVILQMQEIEQVPDTGSYSQRNTDQDRILHQNKQNMQNYCNYYPLSARERHPRIINNKLAKQKQTLSLSALNHRERNNCSRKSSHKSSTSQTKSTIEYIRKRNKNSQSKCKLKSQSKQKQTHAHQTMDTRALKQKISMLQRNVKLIWQYLGHMTQNARASKQLNQKTTSQIKFLQQNISHKINQLSQKQYKKDKQLNSIKIEISNLQHKFKK